MAGLLGAVELGFGPDGAIMLVFADGEVTEAQSFEADDLCWHALVRSAQAAKESLRELPGPWQPIATAPQDGREILVYGTRYGSGAGPGVYRAGWRSDYPGGEAYWQSRMSGPSVEILDPSHWCPWPAPPHMADRLSERDAAEASAKAA